MKIFTLLLLVLVGEKAVPLSELVCLFPMEANHFHKKCHRPPDKSV